MPFIEADLQLSSPQMTILMKGLIYITPCQSRFVKKSIDTIVTEQVNTVCGPVKGCLADHGWLPREPKDKEAFPSLKDRLYPL